MKKLFVLVVVLILVGAASWAQSNTGTGQWLHGLWINYQKIHTTDKDWSAIADAKEYMGVVWGAAHVMRDANWIDLEGTTQGQMWAVVGKYLDDHPEQWNFSAEALVYLALYAVWPGKVAAPYR